jgi:uncharacterized RDD family membrane protein YckC
MFCPFCGIKNNLEQQTCFVCSRRLPSLDSEQPNAIPRSYRGPRDRGASTVERARMRDRLLAVFLDLLFVGAVVLIAAAALWSRGDDVVREVNRYAIAASAALVSLLLVFVYNWIAEEAFGATIGKAFAGVRVIRRERPLSLGARLGVMAFWLIAVGAAVWGTFELCPQWFMR